MDKDRFLPQTDAHFSVASRWGTDMLANHKPFVHLDGYLHIQFEEPSYEGSSKPLVSILRRTDHSSSSTISLPRADNLHGHDAQEDHHRHNADDQGELNEEETMEEDTDVGSTSEEQDSMSHVHAVKEPIRVLAEPLAKERYKFYLQMSFRPSTFP